MQRAVVFAAKIEYIDAQSATVRSWAYTGRLGAEFMKYRLVYKGGRWTIILKESDGYAQSIIDRHIPNQISYGNQFLPYQQNLWVRMGNGFGSETERHLNGYKRRALTRICIGEYPYQPVERARRERWMAAA
jgi:hypothetical protein